MAFLKNLIVAGAMGVMSVLGSAFAAPLAVTPTNPIVVVNETTLEFTTSVNGFGFTIADAFVFPGAQIDSATGITLPVPAFIELFLDYNVADVSDFNGSFCVFTGAFCAGSDEVVSGLARKLGFDTDRIEILFGDLTGAQSGLFPAGSLAVITFLDAIGANPLSSLQDGQSFRVRIEVSGATPIPLPGAALFLLTGIGVLGARRYAGLKRS